MRVLAGDIGGTKTLLQIAEGKAGRCRAVREQRFGSAGPVKTTAGGQSVKVTNLPWEIHGQELKRRFKFPRLRLINDFQAIGYGIAALSKKDLVVLQKGKAVKRGPRAVIGAGTGLGEGKLNWNKEQYEPLATEGGHANFAPTNELQLELTRHLLKTVGRTSWELVL